MKTEFGMRESIFHQKTVSDVQQSLRVCVQNFDWQKSHFKHQTLSCTNVHISFPTSTFLTAHWMGRNTIYCPDSNNSYGENDSNKFIWLNFEPLTNSYTRKKNIIFSPLITQVIVKYTARGVLYVMLVPLKTSGIA